MDKNWLREGIIYQIMPDKFNMADGQTIEEKSQKGLFHRGAISLEWGSEPSPEKAHRSFYGGDLAGITEKVEYLKELGVTALYTTPIFQSPSVHKYDTIDYKKIDPALGTEEDLQNLIKKLHENNMKLIIDIVPNHISSESPYFLEAISGEKSKYRDFFTFKDYPSVYNCWRNHRTIPELNYENPEVVREFVTGEDSYIRYWVRKGIDGIRIDCANDMGSELAKLIRETAKEENPAVEVIGEIWNYGVDWLDKLDGIQSYYFTDSLHSMLTRKISTRQFGKNITGLVENAGIERISKSFLQLSSHDYKRVLNTLDDDLEKYNLALLIQYTMPGVPMIYYGEEVGMKGQGEGSEPYNRYSMIWDGDKQNKKIFALYREYIKLRKHLPELVYGELDDYSQWLENGVVSYLRYLPEDKKRFSLIVANSTEKTVDFRLFIPYSYLYDNMVMEDYFTGKKVRYTNYLDLTLAPYEGLVLNPDADYIENYSFYKRT